MSISYGQSLRSASPNQQALLPSHHQNAKLLSQNSCRGPIHPIATQHFVDKHNVKANKLSSRKSTPGVDDSRQDQPEQTKVWGKTLKRRVEDAFKRAPRFLFACISASNKFKVAIYCPEAIIPYVFLHAKMPESIFQKLAGQAVPAAQSRCSPRYELTSCNHQAQASSTCWTKVST